MGGAFCRRRRFPNLSLPVNSLVDLSLVFLLLSSFIRSSVLAGDTFVCASSERFGVFPRKSVEVTDELGKKNTVVKGLPSELVVGVESRVQDAIEGVEGEDILEKIENA